MKDKHSKIIKLNAKDKSIKMLKSIYAWCGRGQCNLLMYKNKRMLSRAQTKGVLKA